MAVVTSSYPVYHHIKDKHIDDAMLHDIKGKQAKQNNKKN